VKGAKQKFDPRWTLFFTPHSAHIDPELQRQAQASVFSDAGLSLGTPARLRDSAQLTRKSGLTGYIASCEPFTCIDGPPGSNKPRQKPFYFEWLPDGKNPLNELPARVNRIAFREYTANPGLPEAEFRLRLGRELFGSASSDETVADALFLQDCWFNEAGWFSPSPLLRPKDLKAQAEKEKWPAERMKSYLERVERLGRIQRQHARSTNAAERELARIARVITQKWDDAR
jgi:hypothetical protein